MVALSFVMCGKQSPQPAAAGATWSTPVVEQSPQPAASASGATEWNEQARWTERGAPPPNDWFGDSVALSDTLALVGANFRAVGAHTRQGEAFVFARSATTWQPQAVLTASDGQAEDGFGVSVALSATTALVGADAHAVGANPNQGAAYVFVQSGTTWTQQAVLTAPDGEVGDFFGGSVALSGDIALVGAHDHKGSSPRQGAAYVFVRSGGTWTQQAVLTAGAGATGDYFGVAVALSGRTAIVGAQVHRFGSHAGPGAAFVFGRNGTTWTEQATLTATDGADSDNFGAAVALSGPTALVGAFHHTVGSSAAQGAAYVFTKSGTTWTQQATLTAHRGAAQDYFGAAVALSGPTALVGAPLHWIGFPHVGPVPAYVFAQRGATWTEQAQLTSREDVERDSFGTSVALSGTTALVGASGHETGLNAGQGAAYLFVKTP